MKKLPVRSNRSNLTALRGRRAAVHNRTDSLEELFELGESGWESSRTENCMSWLSNHSAQTPGTEILSPGSTEGPVFEKKTTLEKMGGNTYWYT